MRPARVLILVLLASSAAAAAQPAPRDGIESAYRKIAGAIEAKDAAGIGAVLADSFEYTPAEGRPLARGQWLETWGRNFKDVDAYTAASYKLRSVTVPRDDRCRAVVERTVFVRPVRGGRESVQVCRTEDEWAPQGDHWLLRSQRELGFPDDGELADGERPLRSPALRRLRERVKTAGERALDDFCRGLRGSAPLVEKIDADATRRLVTFVFRADPAVQGVQMAGGPYREGGKGLTRLGATDLWYRTEDLPADARFVYFFTVTRPIEKRRADGRPGETVVATLPANDPLNPIQFNGGSVVWPAGEPPPSPSNGPPAPLRGVLHEHKIKSTALGGEERSFSVYAPPPADVPACLLVALDGEDYTGLIPTPAILDRTIAVGRLPPTVGVFVNHQGQRFRDLRCSPAFARFLATELVPWVRARYPVTDRPDRTAVAGASLGGLTAAFAAESYPQVFGKVLSQSGAFWYHPDAGQDGWLASRFAEAGRRPVEFWMEVGAFESPAMVTNNRRLRDVLRAKGYAVRYREYNGGHDFLTWRESLATGLTELFDGKRDDGVSAESGTRTPPGQRPGK